MVRRSAGFVAKRPHRKSRGGCLTCKKKKVKCDESQPTCGYCGLRKLECYYPSPRRSEVSKPTILQQDSGNCTELVSFNDTSTCIPTWIVPAVHSTKGTLTQTELSLLHLYKTSTWRSFVVRTDQESVAVHSEWVPQHCLSQDHLLYALLTVTSMHTNHLNPSPQFHNHALVYRQKTLRAYNKALKNITSDNYEALMLTATLMLALIPVPESDVTNEGLSDEERYLNWVNTFLHMMQGLRMLASLRWSSGMEKLTIYPLFSRELRGLPPSPLANVPMDPRLYSAVGPLGSTPEFPNPPPTYESSKQPPTCGFTNVEQEIWNTSSPQSIQQEETALQIPFRMKISPWQTPSPAFLPPPLMALLISLVNPPLIGPLDLNRNYILPALRAMSPMFLSLYHYHLDPDFYVRIHVYPTYIPTEFFGLVKDREPRALIIMQWYFFLGQFTPNQWITKHIIPKVVLCLGNVLKSIVRTGTNVLDVGLITASVEAVDRIMQVMKNVGKEEAAKSIFDGWEGVNWEDGQEKTEIWEFDKFMELQ